MADRKPGPICSSRLGSNWIDSGTTCRSRSSSSGPLGLMMSLVMSAAPGSSDAEAQKAMMAYDIDIIAESPFGKTSEGKQIVQLLRSLNQRGNIVYGETVDDVRGDWDGKMIRVNENSRGKIFPKILELVHEGSHALWRKNHPIGNVKDNRKDNVADELHAQENQLLIYSYLKEKKGCPEDLVLELRLKRQASGTLRQTIDERFTK